MNRYTTALGLLFVCLVLLASGSNPRAFSQEPDTTPIPTDGGMPPRALPSRPIPHHEPGHPAKAAGYDTQVQVMNAAGTEESVQVTGLDALLADGVMDDPLQSNYRLVSLDKLMWSVYRRTAPNHLSLQTFELVTSTLTAIPGSEVNMGDHRFYDIAAGDLSGDLQDEQIAAWIGAGNQIYLSIGEMPGSFGRATSAPAVVSSTGALHLVVRGYDDALWHHDGAEWRQAGGRLLSGPAVASRAAGQFDAFAVGLDDSVEPNYLVVWRNQFDIEYWTGWQALDNLGAVISPTVERDVPTPELPAPAVVVSGTNQLVLFWLWPDNTLHWRHFNGANWGAWQNLGGMLASGPGAVAHDGQIDVFARGVDGALWTRTYTSTWGAWQRVDQPGMPGGVTIASAPAVVSPAAGQVLVTVRGSDGGLWQLTYDGSSWGNWNLAGLNKSTSGQAGQALGLDGVDDYVDLPDNLANVTDFTFAAWVYWNGGQAWQRIFDFGRDTDANMFLTPSNGTNTRFAITAGGAGAEQRLNASTPITPAEWVHVAVTLDGDQGKLYINGSAVDTQTITLNPHDVVGANTWLGKSQYAADPAFAGKIDEVAVFTRALSAPEIVSIYSSGWGSVSGKVLALHLDENPATHGTTLTDVSGSGNDGTLYTFGRLAGAPAAVAHGGQIDLFARTSDGHLGNLQYDGSTWMDWADFEGLDVAAVVSSIDAWAYTIPPPYGETVGDFENVLLDVETGYFTGDGRQQIVLAYQSAANKISIKLYDIRDGFTPRVLAEWVGIDGIVPRIAAADVDGDGVDEIGLASIINHHEGKVQLRVFKFGKPLPSFDSGVVLVVGPTDRFGGTLRIAGGDIVSEPPTPNLPKFNDEFVVVSDWHHAGTYEDLITDMQLYDLDDTSVFRPLTQKRILAHDIDTTEFYLTGVGLAVGDVTASDPGHGVDEIIVTWPRVFDGDDWGDLYRDLIVYGCCEPNGALKERSKYEIPNYSRISFLDNLTAGDLDQDLQDEIVLAAHHAARDYSQGYYLEAYEFGTLTDGPLYRYSLTLGATSWPPHLGFNLATGDFTGESLHVGPPTYRLESKVGGLIALINEPPKHFDTIDGVDYDINSTDSGTYASYENEQSQSTNMSLQVTRDWGMASGLEVTAGDPEGTHVKTSIDTTYGEHFENTTDTFSEITFGSSIVAAHDDLVEYSRTDYQVWEYPVYNDLGDAAGYITVVFPQAVGNNQGTVEAFTPGNTCDFWYQPNHEINNVWSYPTSTAGFTDYDLIKGALNQIQPFTLGGGEGDFYTSWLSVTTAYTASAVNLGVSAGVEAQVGGDEIPIIGYKIPWSVKASFEGSYAEGTLSTHEVQGSDSTTVHTLFNVIDGSASYEVTPYLYWSQDGYLVLDYATNPIMGTSFWSRYDKADPSFSRPWSDGHCGADRVNFSKEVLVSPSFVSNGEVITVTAMVRNFSNVSINNVQVRFYQGDPAQGGVQLCSEQTITTLGPRGLQKVSIQTPIYGSGEQRIYAVIDPAQQLTEMHRDNNIAYGVMMMGASDYVDPGRASQLPYDSLTYADAISITAYIPPGNATETTRFELKGSSLSVSSVVGEPFDLLAYRGSSGSWDTPVSDLDLKPRPDDPPAVIAIAYDDADIMGVNEANLRLFRRSTYGGWQEAICEQYTTVRFPEENLIAVPVCQAGTFALSAETPVETWLTFLPLVLKNAP